MSVKILAVGDVCGEPGLAFLNNNLKKYREEQGIGFVVVNGENANVVGITPKQADLILRAGKRLVRIHDRAVALVRGKVAVAVVGDKSAQPLTQVQEPVLGPQVQQAITAGGPCQTDDAPDTGSHF